MFAPVSCVTATHSAAVRLSYSIVFFFSSELNEFGHLDRTARGFSKTLSEDNESKRSVEYSLILVYLSHIININWIRIFLDRYVMPCMKKIQLNRLNVFSPLENIKFYTLDKMVLLTSHCYLLIELRYAAHADQHWAQLNAIENGFITHKWVDGSRLFVAVNK